MKYKIGDEVKLTIIDHAMHTGPSTHGLMFNVYGRVIAQDKVTVTVATWLDVGGNIDDDTESFTIVKKAIIKGRKI